MVPPERCKRGASYKGLLEEKPLERETASPLLVICETLLVGLVACRMLVVAAFSLFASCLMATGTASCSLSQSKAGYQVVSASL